MAEEDPNPSEACDRSVHGAQSDRRMIDEYAPDAFLDGGMVEESEDLPAKPVVNDDAGGRQLASLQYDVKIADIRILVSLLVVVVTFLMRWYFKRRKSDAWVKDQKYMVGFCPTTRDNSDDENINNSNRQKNVVVSTSKHIVSNATICSNRIDEIRNKQQEKILIENRRTQQQLHSQQHIRRRKLQSDLDHRAANDAYTRRMNVIAQESLLLQTHHNIGQQSRQVNELVEMERSILLQEQDVEYQQSLENDEHRARQHALKNEIESRRVKALYEARQRLAVAGIAHHSIEITDNHEETDLDIAVRLLLPSGQKIDGKFASEHSIGLVYDFALLALDECKLLWSPDEEDGNNNDDANAAIDAPISGDASSTDDNIYNEIKREWRQLFYPFSIASSYPKRTYDNLSMTLENCGFHQQGSIAWIVVVESN
ncbi:hypothetical protein ACHAXH_009145 [Discostella pseudostelligera]